MQIAQVAEGVAPTTSGSVSALPNNAERGFQRDDPRALRLVAATASAGGAVTSSVRCRRRWEAAARVARLHRSGNSGV